MFKEISEGIKTYRLELVAYLIWLEKKNNEYGTHKDSFEEVFGVWDDRDFIKIQKWDSKLCGMMSALGLSKEEDAAIMAEAKEIIEKLKKEERGK